MSMKRYAYIVAFMVLGLLVSFIIHAAIEIPTLALIVANPDALSEQYLWRHWRVIHSLGGYGLSITFLFLGFFLGRKFWRILYVEKRYGTPRW